MAMSAQKGFSKTDSQFCLNLGNVAAVAATTSTTTQRQQRQQRRRKNVRKQINSVIEIALKVISTSL